MSPITYLGLKVIVSTLRILTPNPVSPKPDEVLPIQSRDANRKIKTHIYHSKSPSTPSPVLLNFHGSGFIMPFHGSDDVFCRHIADKTSYTVIDVQYRLAPEHPFPAAIHDVEDAIKYVLSKPDIYDTSRISLSGFSAGANLALAVLSSKDIPKDTIHTVIAVYPVVDLSINPAEKFQPDPSGKNVIPIPAARLFNACYIGKGDRKDPLVSPSFMDVSRLPKKVLILSCAHDILAPEAERLAEKIETEGGGVTEVVSKRLEGVVHGWDKSCKAGSEDEKKRDEAYKMAVDILV